MSVNFLIIVSLIGSLLPTSLSAQELPAASAVQQVEATQPAPQPVTEQTDRPPQVIFQAPHGNFAEHFLKDQEQVWSSPFRLKRGDVKWLLPIGAGAAALLATDRKVANAVNEADNLRPASRFLSKLGGGAPTMIASGSLYGMGKLAHNEKAAETGKLAAEAVLHTQLVVQGMKIIFNRERPNKLNGTSGFWDGGRSFPSGHAATSFAFATVVANRYKDKKLIVVGAYGLATAVSLSRIGGMNHHPSDVLIGAVVGHLMGRYILHRHPAEN